MLEFVCYLFALGFFVLAALRVDDNKPVNFLGAGLVMVAIPSLVEAWPV